MKLLFVVGGSYKSFYLNELKKINKIDLLIFQQNIFYEFNYEEELCGNAIVSKELISLNKILNCPIVIYGESNLLGKKQKCLITCINGKVSIVNDKDELWLHIRQKWILISNKIIKYSKTFITISLIDFKLYDIEKYKKYKNTNFICHKTGVIKLKNDKIYKKFRKYCYFSLP